MLASAINSQQTELKAGQQNASGDKPCLRKK
ncbi:hypothetical protein [Shewanella acanthi]|nr:hypothetical protein [Shewanella acanthi]